MGITVYIKYLADIQLLDCFQALTIGDVVLVAYLLHKMQPYFRNAFALCLDSTKYLENLSH